MSERDEKKKGIVVNTDTIINSFRIMFCSSFFLIHFIFFSKLRIPMAFDLHMYNTKYKCK